jgi:hypothetical protein
MKTMLIVPALLAWSATAHAQGYDPSYSSMLNQNQRDIDAGRSCFVGHDSDACAYVKRRKPQIQQETRMIEDRNQFEGAKNQSEEIYGGIGHTMDQTRLQNQHSFAVEQADGWANAAIAARARGDFQGFYRAQQQATEWAQRADALR